jgi:hypothetical protein
MALETANALKLADELVAWYWEHGIKRPGLYALATNDWLRRLYTCQRRLAQAESAAQDPRQAFALWGPSQSGKSTLLSNFLDQLVWSNLKEGELVNGTLSALYWSGGDPCVFYVSLPMDQLGRARDVISVNPFTGGRDASAVLTRFVRGSLRPVPGVYHVSEPKHPVEVRLLGEAQVLQALALGYDGECLGAPSQLWQQREWTQTELRNVLDAFALNHRVPDKAPVSREAYAVVHDLCEVLEDLVFSGLRRFQRLRTDAREAEEWRGLVHSLLAQPCLVTRPEFAREFVAQVLWDGSAPITRHYLELLRKRKVLQEHWGNRLVRCSMRVAALLLNMDAYDLIERRQQPLPSFRQEVRADEVLLDCEASGLPAAPCETVKDFGLLQGLVWEIIMPVNFDNLPATLTNGQPNTFRGFLEQGDLLDFPGVANDVAGKSTRIAAWDDISETDAKRLNEEQVFSSYRFFAKILKRGKTASIVNTYAKRYTIDGFTIFLFLDQNPPANADQVLNGIRTWWACMAPDFNPDEARRSPLPLNLALTWWKPLYDTCNNFWRKNEEYYSTKRDIVKKLGRVSDANIVWTTFALNYYNIPRGKPADESVTPAYLFDNLTKEKELRTQFRTPECVASIRAMLEDRETGGASYLVGQLAAQLRELSSGGRFNRKQVLHQIRVRETADLDALLRGQHMFPPPEARDIRREQLVQFQKGLREATQRKRPGGDVEYVREEQMRHINHALRELLNVNYPDLEILPSSNNDIRPEFIQKQFLVWARKQAGRWRPSAGPPDESNLQADWNLLGLTSQAVVEAYLSSMVESLAPGQLQEVADWLKRDVRPGNNHPSQAAGDGHRREKHLPFLAVRMSNLLLGHAQIQGGLLEDDETKPPSYRTLVGPFVEEQLPALIDAPVRSKTMVQIPGTRELRDLCSKYGVETATETPRS